MWSEEKGSNVLDGGSPFVAAYQTSDGGHVFVSPLEPKFFSAMLERLGIDDIDVNRQYDPAYWPVIRERLEAVFLTRTRDDWAQWLEGIDACCTPVLKPSEVAAHHHVRARSLMVEVDGVTQPAPAPRFSRTPSEIRNGPGGSEPARNVFERWGVEAPGD